MSGRDFFDKGPTEQQLEELRKKAEQIAMTQPNKPGPSWEKPSDKVYKIDSVQYRSVRKSATTEWLKKDRHGLEFSDGWIFERGYDAGFTVASTAFDIAAKSMPAQEKAAAPGEERKDCPRCGDLFYHPKVLLQDARQGAAEWEDIAKRAEKERDEARVEVERAKQALEDRVLLKRELSSLKAENAALREENEGLKGNLRSWHKLEDTLRQHSASLSEQLAEAVELIKFYRDIGCSKEDMDKDEARYRAFMAKLKAPSDSVGDAGEEKR